MVLSCAHIFAHFYNNLPKQNTIDTPYTLNNSYYLTTALSLSYPSQSVILPFPPICSILSIHPLFQSPVLHSLPPHVSTNHSYGLILVTYSSHSLAHLILLITKILLTAFSYIFLLLTYSLFYCCTYAITAGLLLLTSCLHSLSV